MLKVLSLRINNTKIKISHFQFCILKENFRPEQEKNISTAKSLAMGQLTRLISMDAAYTIYMLA